MFGVGNVGHASLHTGADIKDFEFLVVFVVLDHFLGLGHAAGLLAHFIFDLSSGK